MYLAQRVVRGVTGEGNSQSSNNPSAKKEKKDQSIRETKEEQ